MWKTTNCKGFHHIYLFEINIENIELILCYKQNVEKISTTLFEEKDVLDLSIFYARVLSIIYSD